MAVTGKLYAGASKKKLVYLEDALNYKGFNGWYDGIYEDAYVRTLALSNKTDTLILVVPDTTHTPGAMLLSARLSRKFGIPEQNIILGGTQNHQTPIPDVIGTNEIPPDLGAIRAHMHDIIEESVAEALANLEPAKMGYGVGDCYVNYNRDLPTPIGTIGSVNFHGYSDRELGVLRVDTQDGEPLAVFSSFGVQGLILASPLSVTHEWCKSAPDLSGASMEWMEKSLKNKAVCLLAEGAAGDQSPFLDSGVNILTPDGEGGFTTTRKIINAEANIIIRDLFASLQGLDLYNIYHGIKTFTDEFTLRAGVEWVSMPGRDMGEGHRAQGFQQGKTVSFRLQLAVINEDIAIPCADAIVSSRLGRLCKDVLAPYRSFFCGVVGGLNGYTYDSVSNQKGFGGSASSAASPWDTERAFTEGFRKLAEACGKEA